MKIFSVVILLLLCSQGFSQNTYNFLLEVGKYNDQIDVVEDAEGNLTALITEFTGQNYVPSLEFKRGGFLKFSPQGDTVTMFPVMGDTLFGFNAIIEKPNGGYMIAGYSRLPDSTSQSLMFMEVDGQFNKVWTSHYFFPDVYRCHIIRIIPDGDGYYAFGHVTYSITGGRYPFLSRIDSQGNILRYYIYHDGANGIFEYTFNPDKNRIWLFSEAGLDPINGASRAVFDTNFNHLYSEALDPHEMWAIKHRWRNDTSFYLTFNWRRLGSPFQDDELCIGLYDTLMNPIHFSQFGEYDSFDYPAWLSPISFRNNDSIYYAGTIGVYIGYPPQHYTNYIMMGQTDGQLQERYRRYYGGDGYYLTMYIKATSDGGCFLAARKFNHSTQVYDALFMKLDNKGELVYLVGPEAPLHRFLVYPNPATTRLQIETSLPTYTFIIRDMHGGVLAEGNSWDKKSMIDISHYPAGTYVISFAEDGEFIENQKFIKYK
jgi:hypothetical protein